MSSRTPDTNPSIIVIFGATGDLSRRYLLPSLYRLFRQDLLHERTEIVCISRRDIDLDTDVFGRTDFGFDDNGEGSDADRQALEAMRRRCRPYKLDMDDPAAYGQLLETLNTIEATHGLCMNRLYYLSIPPEAYDVVIANMGTAGLNASCPHGTAATRLLVEKPFGSDLASAERLAAVTAGAFGEEQVFRIDHYLAKESAQNITTFRFENPMFEAIWNNGHVSAIDIVASESIGIEGRGAFYEGQGALRDFIQNHLLQLLAVATMDRPIGEGSQAAHEARLKLMESIRPIADDEVAERAHRGQYEGYRDEAGNPDSITETYAAIRLEIDSSRWQGVPVTIRTGKRMAHKYSSVSLTFADRRADPATDQTNMLTFRLSPHEGVELSLRAKQPGFEHQLQDVHMDFSYADHFDGEQPTAYERVLIDSVRGDRTLFASSQEVLAAWRVVDAVVQAWNADGDSLQSYRPGTPIDELQ
jgi:glucose-6-phosphate 1-dehydrogenase